MRYLMLVCFVACGGQPSTDCNDTGCKAGKWCNPNTGLCVTPLAAGGGHGGTGGGASSAGGGAGGSGGHGGGTVSTGGGSGGGGFSGPTVDVIAEWDMTQCQTIASTCGSLADYCFTTSRCKTAAYRLPASQVESWRLSRYSTCVIRDALQAEQLGDCGPGCKVVDCTQNCAEMDQQCSNGSTMRARQCAYPDGAAADCSWTP